MDPLLLDDATALRLLDEQALQRRLDARNRRVLPVILWLLLFVFFSELMTAFEDHAGEGWPLAAFGLATAVTALVCLRLLLPAPRDGVPARVPRPALVA